jgi:hypothetical protein
MKKYAVQNWLYLIRVWLYDSGEIIELYPDEAVRYAVQIEVVDAGRYRVRDGFNLQLRRCWLYQPGEIVELTEYEANRYSDRVEEVVENYA